MGAARGGDASDELGRIGFTVDAAQQLVSDCLREPIRRLHPLAERLRGRGAGRDLDARAVTDERGQRPLGCVRRGRRCRPAGWCVGTSRGHCLAFPVEELSEEAALASRGVVSNAANPS